MALLLTCESPSALLFVTVHSRVSQPGLWASGLAQAH